MVVTIPVGENRVVRDYSTGPGRNPRGDGAVDCSALRVCPPVPSGPPVEVDPDNKEDGHNGPGRRAINDV